MPATKQTISRADVVASIKAGGRGTNSIQPKPIGLYADSKAYKSGVLMYRILDSRIEGGAATQVLFESSRAETRDYMLKRMIERSN